MRYLPRLSLALLFILLVGCDDGADDPCTSAQCLEVRDGEESDLSSFEDLEDLGLSDSEQDQRRVDQEIGADSSGGLQAVEPHESEVWFGWLVAGRPGEERIRSLAKESVLIVSLSGEGEEYFDEASAVLEEGGRFHRAPTSGTQLKDPAFRAALFEVLEAERQAQGHAYIHCTSSNRSGAIWALYLAESLEVDPEEAIRLAKEAGLSSLEGTVREVLGL